MGFGFRVSGFGYRVSGLGFDVSGLGFSKEIDNGFVSFVRKTLLYPKTNKYIRVQLCKGPYIK